MKEIKEHSDSPVVPEFTRDIRSEPVFHTMLDPSQRWLGYFPRVWYNFSQVPECRV